jgi:hypothetical protein
MGQKRSGIACAKPGLSGEAREPRRRARPLRVQAASRPSDPMASSAPRHSSTSLAGKKMVKMNITSGTLNIASGTFKDSTCGPTQRCGAATALMWHSDARCGSTCIGNSGSENSDSPSDAKSTSFPSSVAPLPLSLRLPAPLPVGLGATVAASEASSEATFGVDACALAALPAAGVSRSRFALGCLVTCVSGAGANLRHRA